MQLAVHYEIWEYCQNTKKVQASILQNPQSAMASAQLGAVEQHEPDVLESSEVQQADSRAKVHSLNVKVHKLKSTRRQLQNELEALNAKWDRCSSTNMYSE